MGENMSSVLKIGFIGGGINSAVGNTHRIACQMDHRWQLVAGCFSTHSNVNRETADSWGVEPSRRYDDWRIFLENEQGNLDAIGLLTPTPLHAEMAVEALHRGFAVICEKTMAASSREAAAICRAVEENNGFLAVTYNYTGYPMLRELRQMIVDGKLGTVNLVQIEMPQEGFARLNKHGQKPQPQAWRLHDGNIPIISLDLGSHLHHMIFFLLEKNPWRSSPTSPVTGFSRTS